MTKKEQKSKRKQKQRTRNRKFTNQNEKDRVASGEREQIEKTRRSQGVKKKVFLRHDVDFRLNAFAPAFHAEIRWHVSVNVPFDFDPKIFTLLVFPYR